MPILAWLKRVIRRRLDEDDFEEEIRSHLAIAADEKVADGTDPESAHSASLKDFGNVMLTTEAARRVWTPPWLAALHDLASDVRFAVRALAKKPAFALTVVGVLTLGIGANAAVFTMLKGIALSPVAGVPGSARIHVVYGETSAGRAVGLSYPDYQHLRDHDRAFVRLFATNVGPVNLGRGRGARQIWAEIVTGNYFEGLGVRAALGRTLLPSDEIAPGRHPVVVISDGLWRRDFGADPQILGRTIEVNNHALTVVGVADPSFHGTTVVYDVEAYIPVMMAPDLGFRFGSQETTPSGILSDRRADVFNAQGYLRAGTTPRNALAQAEALWAAQAQDRPLTEAAQRLRVVPFWQTPGGAPMFVLPTLGVLSAMGLLVLTVACANIAGLVLVRGVSRRGEMALRLAIGATRGRIVRLLVAENLVLAVPGAILGVVLAQQAIPVLVRHAEWMATPERVFFNVGVDTLVVGFAVLVACGSALLFGLAPAIQASQVDLVTVINEDASTRGASRGRVRAALVVAQVAASLLLLVGSGLAARSVDAALGVHPGFDVGRTTVLRVDARQNGYDERGGRVLYRKMLEAARAQPGIESATLAEHTPLALLEPGAQRVAIEGYEARRGEDLALLWNAVSSDYFRTLRIPLLAGREFEERDDEDAAPAVIVNRTLAERFWGGAEAAIGKRVRLGEHAWRTVVGVAADVKYLRIDEAPRPYVYVPFPQSYRPRMVLHVRGAAPDDRLVEQARAAVASVDPELPVLFARPLAETTRGALIFLDLTAATLFVFGLAGMALAAMGTYGVVSYVVKQSTREIGIRMALGASRASVVRAFVGRGLRLGAVGAGLGILAAIGLGRLMGGVLFGVSPTDGVALARALAVVLGGVCVASVVPAWRAARTNPLTALRHQ